MTTSTVRVDAIPALRDSAGSVVYALRYVLIAYVLFALVNVNLNKYYQAQLGGPVPGRNLAIYGTNLGFASPWRMYSPVPREIHRIEWHARHPSDGWVSLEPPNLSAEHRQRQSFLDRWFFDFKTARIWDNYFIYQGATDRSYPEAYLSYHRVRLSAELGWKPSQIRVLVWAAEIPPPAERGDWTPHDAEFDRLIREETYP